MADVTASTERIISAPAFKVRRFLADYTVRPTILTDSFSDYVLHSGTVGKGTVAGWKLAATKKRDRDVLVDVSVPNHDTIVETDRNSSMVTTWTISAGPPNSCQVRVTATWKGAGGIGGFFERRFAPKGLAAIYDGVLDKLEAEITAQASPTSSTSPTSGDEPASPEPGGDDDGYTGA